MLGGIDVTSELACPVVERSKGSDAKAKRSVLRIRHMTTSNIPSASAQILLHRDRKVANREVWIQLELKGTGAVVCSFF